ncbi:MAG TPA: SRPBCC family protein [Methylomirabilota bacterium]|nr:SRPBCC family protein [Methylomirabilota bacterium]
MGERLAFSASVEIRAEAEEVFALVSDLRRKAVINPNVRVIRVELEGGEPIREGSVFYHRFQREGRIVEYRSRVMRCEPPRLIESRSESDPPFEVRVRVEPVPGGCRLAQEETVEVTPEALDALDPAPARGRSVRDALKLLTLFPSARLLEAELRAHQRERVARRLARELEGWLEAIRQHLEAGSRR